MKKDNHINLRLSDKDKELIERVAAKCKFKNVSKFIRAVLIPYCCKIDSKDNTENKKGDT